jgi:uroporphyrinogen-III synthase
MVVIVTRPASAGKRLFDRVIEQGHRALWWPAFDIDAAPDVERARATLARLADYDLAIFVSVHAVRAARAVLDGAWPCGTMIGAVGASTRAAIEAELQPDPSLIVMAQDEDQHSGSEAFWRAWEASARRARRVLVLRAEDGRNWLSKRFAEHGAQVDTVAVYSRRLHRASVDERQQLQHWITANERPAIIFSSTEAVAALDQQIDATGQAWLRTGTAIACHPRIAEQLSSNGYARVINATFDDDSIVAKLESIGIEPQAL